MLNILYFTSILHDTYAAGASAPAAPMAGREWARNQWGVYTASGPRTHRGCAVELSTNLHEVSQCPEKDPTTL